MIECASWLSPVLALLSVSTLTVAMVPSYYDHHSLMEFRAFLTRKVLAMPGPQNLGLMPHSIPAVSKSNGT
jgi:hypothetical protein